MYKPVPGWELYYEVNERGDVRNKQTGHLLVGDLNSSGYPRVQLYNINHIPKKQRFFRHRLVASVFVPNFHNLPEVDHIDGNRLNPHYTNLRWVTSRQNERYARIDRDKLYKPFLAEREDGIHTYDFVTDLADELEVPASTVLAWLRGKSNTYGNYGINMIKYIER